MSARLAAFVEQLLQWMKRMERRWYSARYEELRCNEQWSRIEKDAPYELRSISRIPERESIRSILIFKPDEIGDAIHALPAIQELRRSYPAARMCLLCQKNVSSIYKATQLFDEIVGVDVKTYFWRFSFFKVKKALAQFPASEFSMAIFLRTYPKYFRQFKKVSATIKVHPRDPRLRSRSIYQPRVLLWGEKRVHQTLQMLQIVAPFTGKNYEFSDVKFPDFKWEENDKRSVETVFSGQIPKRYFIVHRFARFETRRYPDEFWNEVCLFLRKKWKMPILVIGGREDPQLPPGEGVIQLQGKLSLTQTGYLISLASAFLGNESGPAHLSAALGVPTIVFFGGHSLIGEWAPLGKTLVLTTEVPCSPCHRRICPGYDIACLKNIKPTRVFPEIADFIEKHG